MNLSQLFFGLGLGITFSAISWKIKVLTWDGALAAAVIGTITFGLGGLPWAILLLAFFISSSGLSRMFSHRKSTLDEKFSKGSQRDWGQVVANGGLATVVILFQPAFPNFSWPWWAFAGALAAVNADTWATEIGTLSSGLPRLITTGRNVERGTSGGITLAGTFAALVGAALIGGVAGAIPVQAGIRTVSEAWFLLGAISLSGLTGSLVDSVLGATLQTIYFCSTCGKETERHPHHKCGTLTVQKRGISWFKNDWVNFSASAAGAVLASFLSLSY
jgi:uncharacterized protein (TIGR00297 family)